MLARALSLVAIVVMIALGSALPAAADTTATSDQGELTAAAVQLDGKEEYLAAYINLYRSFASRSNLTIDPALQALARERSNEMAANNYFSHTTLSGETVLSILPQRGVNYRYAGETLQRNNFPDAQVVAEAITSLMNSQAHHDILMDPAFTHFGVGHAVRDGMHYFTVIVVQY